MPYGNHEYWCDYGTTSDSLKRKKWESRRIGKISHLELCEKLLKDILAVAHRDGGQYTAEHGIEKSARDAMKIISEAVVVGYGCHCVPEEEGQLTNYCVIDFGDYDDCIYAKRGMRKEQCKYWRVVK